MKYLKIKERGEMYELLDLLKSINEKLIIPTHNDVCEWMEEREEVSLRYVKERNEIEIVDVE